MRYRWQAVYRDGSALDQFKQDGSQSKYTDIDRKRLSQFIVYDGDKPFVVLHLLPHMKLVCRMRNFIRMSMDDSGQEQIWLVGWHTNKDGVNFQTIFVLFEDGHIEVLDRWRDDYAPYSQPRLLPEEL